MTEKCQTGLNCLASTPDSTSPSAPASTPVLEVQTEDRTVATETDTKTEVIPVIPLSPTLLPVTQTHNLNRKHYHECVVKRGLPPEWILVNVRSMDEKEATDRLGYLAKSKGMWLEGSNGFGQFKPDKVWKGKDEEGKTEKKAPKYRTATKEEYDAMLPTHPTNPKYWTDFVALRSLARQMNGHPCLLITEGLFKAIMACFHGMPCIALAGVEMGLKTDPKDPQSKKYLVETLELLAKQGFGFIIIFDADSATNSNIKLAQRKLAYQLSKFKVPVYISSGWDINLGKGMDDYIHNEGKGSRIEQFKSEVVNKVVDFSFWEQQFNQNQEPKKLPPSYTALELAQKYREKWKYDLEQQTWRGFNGKVWQTLPDKVFERELYTALKLMRIEHKHYSFVENVVKFLQLELLEEKWTSFDRSKWIAFNDYVLEVETGKVHNHSSGFMFTSHLKHNCPKLDWDKGGDILTLCRLHAPNFFAYAMYAQNGDALKVLKMLAFLNGTLTYRFASLQMFMLLLGSPGAGKGTFVRILETAVGVSNFTSAKLHRLGEDNVIASVIDKQLVICPDEKKQNSDISGLLSLTGGDTIPYRQIYKPMSSAKFHGSVIIVANNNPFVGDTIGIDRRLSLLQFDKPFALQDPLLEEAIQAEVGILISLALVMDEKLVPNLIRGREEGFIPDFKRQMWLHKTENDSIAYFVEEMLVPADPEHYVLLGVKEETPDSTTLYGAYLQLCRENNITKLYNKNNFRTHLLEICREVGWAVRDSRCGNGWRIYGVRLRTSGDNSPRISDFLSLGQTVQTSQCRNGVNSADPTATSVDPDVDPKALQDKDSVGSVGSVAKEGNNFGQPQSPLNNPQSNQPQQNQQSGNQTPNNQLPSNPEDSKNNLNVDEEAKKAYTPTPAAPSKDLESTSGSTPAYTTGGEPTLTTLNKPSTSTPSNDVSGEDKKAETTGSADVEETLGSGQVNLAEEITKLWQDKSALGNLVLTLADTSAPALKELVATFNPDQIKHLKNAAKQVWKPNCTSIGEYKGEKCELMEFGNNRYWKIKLLSGTTLITASRHEVYPYLGF